MAQAKRKRRKARQASPKKPVTLPDLGLITGPRQAGCIIEDAVERDPDGKTRNPNGVKRARRLSVAETYHRQGKLTARQLNAAQVLQAAYEARFRSASGELGVKVDHTAKPDQTIAIQIDRQSRYVRLSRLLDGNPYRAYVEHVIEDRFLSSMPGYRKDGRYLARLQDGLEKLAHLMEFR